MRANVGQVLLVLGLLIVVLLGNRPALLATRVDAPQAVTTGVAASIVGIAGPVAAARVIDLPDAPAGASSANARPVAPADSPLRPCAVAAHRDACDAAAAELAAYGLDI